MKVKLDYFNEYLELLGTKQSQFVSQELADSILDFIGRQEFFENTRSISDHQFWRVEVIGEQELTAKWLADNRQLVIDWINTIAEQNGSDDPVHYANVYLKPMDYMKERTDVVEKVLLEGDTTHKNSMKIANFLCRTVATALAKGFTLYVEEETKNQIVWF